MLEVLGVAPAARHPLNELDLFATLVLVLQVADVDESPIAAVGPLLVGKDFWAVLA